MIEELKRRFLSVCLLSALVVITASADGRRLRRPGGCVADDASAPTRSAATRATASLQGEVHIPIILAAFSDVPFTVENVQQEWSDIANKPGYSGHGARGSMADYFREQSRGLFQVSFDVLGPVTLPKERAYYGENSFSAPGSDKNISYMIRDACQLAAELPGVDFSRYDWNGDGTVETVLVVYAGAGENIEGAPTELIWPKQSSVWYSAGGLQLSKYACSNELVWPAMRQDGFGTLLHEFSHCLGLPDLYNVDNNVADYIIFDEWDVMDGGCYAGSGWQPVGYSAYERYLCGWLEPEELSTSVPVEAMRPLSDGGMAYLVRNDVWDDKANEVFLLENRQQQFFDSLLPGHGLLVTHIVDYGSRTFRPNEGSSITVSPVAADNLSYLQSLRRYVENYYGVTPPATLHNLTSGYKTMLYDEDGRNRLLAGLAYPCVSDGTVVNDRLTDDSQPAAVTYYSNVAETSDGLISFRFMDSTDGIRQIENRKSSNGACFDLQGRRLSGTAPRSVCIVRCPDGTVRKIVR